MEKKENLNHVIFLRLFMLGMEEERTRVMFSSCVSLNKNVKESLYVPISKLYVIYQPIQRCMLSSYRDLIYRNVKENSYIPISKIYAIYTPLPKVAYYYFLALIYKNVREFIRVNINAINTISLASQRYIQIFM